MFKHQKFARTLTVFCCAALLAGCSGKSAGGESVSEKTSSTPSTSDSSAVSAAKENASSDSEQIEEFTVWFAKNNYAAKYEFNGEDQLSKWIMDNKHVKINFEGATGDWRQVYALMLSSDDLPDCIRGLGTGSEYLQTIKLGKLVPLDEYMEKYDGYTSIYSQNQIDIMKVDGKSYTMINWGHYDGTISGGNGGWGYNDQIYEQLGSPKLTTLDELYDYLVQVKNSGITANGQPVIPLQSSTHTEILGSLAMVWSAYGEGRSSSELSRMTIDRDGDFRFVMEDDKLLEALLFMNKLYREELINQDCFVEKNDQVDEKIMSGRVAVYGDAAFITRLGGCMSKIMGSGDLSTTYTVMEPIAAAGIDQADVYTDNQMSIGSGGITITTAAKNPEAIYAYHDWQVTPEGQYTLGFGPEGILWEYDEEGMPKLKEGKSLVMSSEELSALPIYSFFTLGQSNLYNEAKMKINRSLPEDQQDWLIAAQDKVCFRHTKDITEYVNVNTDINTDENDIYVDCKEILGDAYISMITAPNEDDVRRMYEETKNQIYSMNFESVLKVLKEKWQKNKEIMGK